MPYRYTSSVLLFFSYVAIGNLSSVGSFQRVQTLDLSDSVAIPPFPAPDECVTIGIGMSPVPAKLVSRIQAGEYINMTELLSDRLGTTRSPTNDDSVSWTLVKEGIIRNLGMGPVYCNLHGCMLSESPSSHSRFAKLSISDHRSFYRVPRRRLVRI